MKRIACLGGLIIIVLFSLVLNSCTDNCQVTRTYRTAVSTTMSTMEIRNGVKQEAPRELEKPAKIYTKDGYLFISESKKGIHIINNSNPSNPVNVGFVAVPGVIDMAVKNNTLYVDSYMDVVALDISNPIEVKEVGRQKDVFENGFFQDLSWSYNSANGIVYDTNWEIITETVLTDCGSAYQQPVYYYGYYDSFYGFASNASQAGQQGIAGGGTGGKAGSMARFTLNEDFLYAVSNTSLQLLDIANEESPVSDKKIDLGWGIETIFPYKDNLFIGSNDAMYIFDNTDRSNPTLLSIFSHSRACDPVVVQSDVAYITLRSGSCGVTPNRLEIVDVKDLSNPKFIKSYPMESPYGLGIAGNSLFLCEGESGLKSFNISNISTIELNQHLKDHNAFDVIALEENLLLMVGKDGFYQYDFSDPKNLKLLSFLPVKKQELQ